MSNALWGLAGVLVGAFICAFAVFYATKRYQTQTIRQANWDRRLVVYVEIDRYLQDVLTYLAVLSDVVGTDRDNEEPLRKFRLSCRTLNSFINDNRGEIDLFVPKVVCEHILTTQTLTNTHTASTEEVEVYWDKKNVQLTMQYVEKTLELMKKDMKLL